MFLQIEHPMKSPPEPVYPRKYDECPYCGENCHYFMVRDTFVVACDYCIESTFDDDMETCPECGYTDDCLRLYQDRAGKIIGCSNCVKEEIPGYNYYLKCLEEDFNYGKYNNNYNERIF